MHVTCRTPIALCRVEVEAADIPTHRPSLPEIRRALDGALTCTSHPERRFRIALRTCTDARRSPRPIPSRKAGRMRGSLTTFVRPASLAECAAKLVERRRVAAFEEVHERVLPALRQERSCPFVDDEVARVLMDDRAATREVDPDAA
jgi:hypothetical protein